MKRLALCADDFSQSPAISRAILNLLEIRRLTHVSCFTLSPTWKQDARLLRAALGKGQAGLHFNLTHSFGGRKKSAGLLLARSLSGGIPRRHIADAFDRQWDAFTDHFGQMPAFIDGHQHVHSFPRIRDIIHGKVSAMAPDCWIRSLAPPACASGGPLKQRILQRLARPPVTSGQRVRTNTSFSGFRSYSTTGGFRRIFRSWLRQADDGTLIMCHPGLPAEDPEDPIRACRPLEYQYLASPRLSRDMDEAGFCFVTPHRSMPMVRAWQ